MVKLKQWIASALAATDRRLTALAGPFAVRWLVRVCCVVIASIIISYLARTAGACRLTLQKDPLTHEKMTWCWEFWLQRYQGLLGVLVAIGAATVAYRDQTRQQREKLTDRRAGARRFMRRLLDRDSRITGALSDIAEVNDVLVRQTQESIKRGDTGGSDRFAGKRGAARKALYGLKFDIEALRELVFEANDQDLEGYLGAYTRWLDPIAGQAERLLQEEKRQVDMPAPPPEFARALPSLDVHLRPARDMRNRVMKRCSELAGEASWTAPPDMWP